jgi:hypothetical protein
VSTRYPGGIITKTPVVPAGPYESGTAPGIWTLDQQLQAQKAGIWPLAGNPVPYIEDVFSTYLYTGTNASQTITNGIDLSGKGGLVWTKNRSALTGGYTGFDRHILFDNIRTGATGGGAGGGGVLRSNAATLDDATTTYLSSYNSTGYTIASNATISNAEFINQSGTTFVSWTFRKQPKFFDVVTWTGNGANRTIAHSLGSVPGAIWVKRIDATGDWQCYHRSLANTQYMVLNTTAAVDTGATRWNSTTPTSSVFSLGTDATVNASAGTYVAYLFAHNAGGFGLTGTDNVISCGSFADPASGGTTEVTLGYEPQWLLVKPNLATTDWYLIDNMRGMVRGSATRILNPNLSAAESNGFSNGYYQPTATGFTAGNTVTGGGGTNCIYIAIRRGPMKVPVDATKVFTPIAATASTGTSRTVGFPADLTINTATGISGIRLVADRLRGYANASSDLPPMLDTNNTTAERTSTAATVYNVWNTTALDGPYYNSYASIWWHFRRAPGFFDEVCYTGTGTTNLQTHNLGVTPELIIIKSRSVSGSWLTLSASGSNYRTLFLNTTDSNQGNFAISSIATSTTVNIGYIGSNILTAANTSAATYVAYLFASAPGVSKVGTYTGTGTTQQINCGFTAGSRFVLIKRTDSTGDWYVWDSARGIVAGNDPYLLLNNTAAEVTSTDYVDTYSAGFEISSTAPAAINANGGSFIFFAVS